MDLTGDFKNKNVEDVLCEMMVSYRFIPLMAYLNEVADDNLSVIAWKELTEMFADVADVDDGDQIISDFMSKNKSWIMYSLWDMAYYALKQANLQGSSAFKVIEDMRNEEYHKRMLEQQLMLEWNTAAFDFPLFGDEVIHGPKKKRTVLDVGCGELPYLGLLNVANPTTIEDYYGLDKRRLVSRSHMIGGTGKAVRIIKCDVTNPATKHLWKKEFVEVLFFAESLHCFKDPLNLLRMMRDELPDLKAIMVLDLDDESMLGRAFSFHMNRHIDNYNKPMRMDSATMSHIAMKMNADMKTIQASSQHKMWRLSAR